MSNREKIIVALMVVSVIYGAYVLFFSSPSTSIKQAKVVSGDKELEALNNFITSIADKTKTGPSQKQAYVLQKAQDDWKQDPFVDLQPIVKEDTGPAPVLDTRVKYTGFLQMGDARLAIISGMEYAAGDHLEPGGFIIRRIFPDHVVVSPPGKNKKTMILPMEETE